MRNDDDAVVLGGGFYRTVVLRVLLVEAGDEIFGRASRVNQARIQAGFHYPRSFKTAMRSRARRQRSTRDFKDAVGDDFEMLHAIAARSSACSAWWTRRQYPL